MDSRKVAAYRKLRALGVPPRHMGAALDQPTVPEFDWVDEYSPKCSRRAVVNRDGFRIVLEVIPDEDCSLDTEGEFLTVRTSEYADFEHLVTGRQGLEDGLYRYRHATRGTHNAIKITYPFCEAYVDNRKSGYGRATADDLARASVASQIKVLEDIGSGQQAFCGVRALAFTADGMTELAESSLWGILDGWDNREYVDEAAQEQLEEVMREARERLADLVQANGGPDCKRCSFHCPKEVTA